MAPEPVAEMKQSTKHETYSRKNTGDVLKASLAMAAAMASTPAIAQSVDFSNFADSFYQKTSFDSAVWTVGGSGSSVTEDANSTPTFFYDTGFNSTLNKRISGKIDVPLGTTVSPDDDIFGIAVGFDNSTGFTGGSDTSDFLLVNWKGLTQGFDFQDDAEAPAPFHDVTGSTEALEGLRVQRVTGTPTADELWGAVDLTGAGLPPGTAEELQRGATTGSVGYGPKSTAHDFAIDYTPSNIKVWIDGTLQIDVDAPVGNEFTDGGLALYESGMGSLVTYSDFSIDDIPATTPTPAATQTIQALVTADNVVTGLTPGVSVVASQNANTGDFDLTSDVVSFTRGFGILIPTVIGNRTGSDVVTAENYSGFNDRIQGAATAPSPAGGEANTDFGVVFFPHAANNGTIGGFYVPGGATPEAIVPRGVTATLERGASLDTNDQDGVFKLTLGGASPSQGLLFTVGSSNEDNVANSTAQSDGSWIIGVRDNGSTQFGGPETFEDDDFSFVYIPMDMPNLVAGEVTDGAGATVGMSAGNFTLTREGVGTYRLSVDGVSAAENVLLLEATASNAVDVLGLGPDTINTVDLPLNHYATYEVDNDDYLIQLIELGTVNAVVDGTFNFAVIAEGGSVLPGDTDGDGDVDDADLGVAFANYTGPLATGVGTKTTAEGDTDGDGDVDDADLGNAFSAYTGPLTAAVPEPTSLALVGLGGLTLARRRRD